MRRSMLVVCALVAGTTLGCDRIKQAIEKRKNRNRPPATATQPAPRDTTKAPPDTAKTAPGAATRPSAGVQPERPQPAPPPQRVATSVARPVQDEPYDSPDTGTVAPGMGERDVVSLWGPASAVRHAGDFTYMHYPNGCERTCGTDDVVILQNDQVVDAILRWPGHGYSGQSSSPPGRIPEPTLP